MKTRICNIIILLFFVIGSSFAQIEGYWKGKIDLGGQQMEMAFDIASTGNGYSTTLDVPAQGAFGIPVDETVFLNNRLEMTMSAMDASYSGTLKGNLIEGEFLQHGMTFPLNLEKGSKEYNGTTRWKILG